MLFCQKEAKGSSSWQQRIVPTASCYGAPGPPRASASSCGLRWKIGASLLTTLTDPAKKRKKKKRKGEQRAGQRYHKSKTCFYAKENKQTMLGKFICAPLWKHGYFDLLVYFDKQKQMCTQYAIIHMLNAFRFYIGYAARYSYHNSSLKCILWYLCPLRVSVQNRWIAHIVGSGPVSAESSPNRRGQRLEVPKWRCK